jgi:hypothetical protein
MSGAKKGQLQGAEAQEKAKARCLRPARHKSSRGKQGRKR